MIKKRELLQAIQNLENQVELLSKAHNKLVDNYHLLIDRAEFVARFLADKAGYEINTKDVIKVVNGQKVIRKEVEMVEKPTDYGISLFNEDGTSKIKPKRKKK
jgi:hypothetical protein